MTYNEALELKRRSHHLIGNSNAKGFTVSQIIILPVDEFEQKAFFSSFLMFWDDEKALEPFKSSDLQVWAIDLEMLNKHRVLFYDKLG